MQSMVQLLLKALKKWLHEIDRYGREDVCTLLVGNKMDLAAAKVVDHDTAKEHADELGVPFMETSAKEGTNVDAAFRTMAEAVFSLQVPEAERGIQQRSTAARACRVAGRSARRLSFAVSFSAEEERSWRLLGWRRRGI